MNYPNMYEYSEKYSETLARKKERVQYRENGDFCLALGTAWIDTTTNSLMCLHQGDSPQDGHISCVTDVKLWTHPRDFAAMIALCSVHCLASPQNMYDLTFVALEYLRLAYGTEAINLFDRGNLLKNFDVNLGKERVENYARKRLEADPVCGWFVRPANSPDKLDAMRIERKLDVYSTRFSVSHPFGRDPSNIAMRPLDLSEMHDVCFFRTERELRKSYGLPLEDVRSLGDKGGIL